ncbi:unnamed protein product [Clonostachys rosea]|uniref:Clr5 domain-containing protein n=1 Tax=Bionectria ochroleuca TaxID=29856 RepID=A0ABY6UF49_BIOOC|nr:unnamed protein product [Clonostachys rosea]
MVDIWTQCKADAERLYFDNNKTAEDTINEINLKFGTSLTVRQFKQRYPDGKNVKAREWMAIIQAIRNRDAVGKSSHVYIHGRRKSQAQVDGAIARYGKHIRGRQFPGIDLGIDTTGRHRIEIRIPNLDIPEDCPSHSMQTAGRPTYGILPMQLDGLPILGNKNLEPVLELPDDDPTVNIDVLDINHPMVSETSLIEIATQTPRLTFQNNFLHIPPYSMELLQTSSGQHTANFPTVTPFWDLPGKLQTKIHRDIAVALTERSQNSEFYSQSLAILEPLRKLEYDMSSSATIHISA